MVLPSGGKVTAGQAQITSTGSATTINQSSAKAILTWDQFSIGQGGLVQFNNGSGATLNRVVGTSLSSIYGKLSATGTVYLINPNGIVIGTKGIVDTGGSFVASTQNISDTNFLNGGAQQFTGTSTARVINLGKVSSLGGNVALIATKVSNEGSISAANGTAGLLAGTSVLLRDAALDDGLFLVQTGGTDTSVTHKGAIEAAAAELKANNGSVYALAGNTNSYIKATGTGTKGGQIWLLAGADGTTMVSGSNLTATKGDQGGFIETSGGTVNVADDANIVTRAANGAFGTWLIDPTDYKVAASGGNTTGAALSSKLATTSVIIKTGALTTTGNGDIFINDTINWSSGSKLTLDAYRNININNVITVAGAGGVSLITGDQAQNGVSVAGAGDYSFGLTGNGFTGRIDYTGAGGSLDINGVNFTLIYGLIPGGDYGPSGNYALAKNIVLNNQVFNSAIFGSLVGNFVGLGHTVSKFAINAPTINYVGLLASMSYGVARDVGISDASITGGSWVGGLAGYTSTDYLVKNTYSSATVAGNYLVGGLVGANGGQIRSSYTTGTTFGTSYVGGLVGGQETQPGTTNTGIVDNSFSTGSVNGQYIIGGLVGISAGTISNSYATGMVKSSAGRAGGLLGTNARLNTYYFGGAFAIGIVTNSFSTGLVIGPSNIGGLVGTSETKYVTSYADYMTNHSTDPLNPTTATIVSNSYWDSLTSGQTTSANGGTGRTTVQLQTVLPTGFSSSLWGTGTGLYPFLKTFGTPTPIAGFAYDATGAASSGATINVYSNGGAAQTVTTGTNGYYYILNYGVTSTSRFGATLTASGASAVSAASYWDGASLLAAGPSKFNLTTGLLAINTAKTSLSALTTDLNATFGASLYSSLISNAAMSKAQIFALGGFAIDSAYSTSRNLTIEARGGDLSLAAGGSVASTATGDGVVLAANGALINNAGASAISTPNGRWLISTTTPDGSAADVFGGLVGKNYYGSTYTFGTGFSKALSSGNRFVHAYRPTLTVSSGTSQTVVYNGLTQSPTIQPGGYAVVGYRAGDQSGDTLTGAYSGGQISGRNAGTYSGSGTGNIASEMNYAISYAPATLTITKAPLTLTTVADTKTYDASTLSTKAVQYSGLLGTDGITGLTQAFDSKNAGSRSMVINGGYVINDGNNGGNYLVSTNLATGTISRAALTLTTTTDSKTYDATTASSKAVQVGGIKGGDTITGLTQAFDSKNAGTRNLVINGGYVVNDGNGGSNYDVTVSQATGTIAKASLTLAATSDNRTYDGTKTSTGTVSVTGLKSGDGITGLSQAFDSKNAGPRNLVVNNTYVLNDGNNGGNYDVVMVKATGRIAKAALTLAAVTDTKVYDGTTLSTKSVTIIGIKTGDSIAGLAQSFDSETAGPRDLSVNTGYVVTDGNNGANYIITTQTADGSITAP